MPAVRSAILFGSTRRGSATEDSDIDLFIECKAEREEEVARALYGIEGVFNVRFGPTFFRQKDWRRFDFQFLESIFRQGQILKGRLPRLTPRDLDLQPLRLVSYYTGELSPQRRAKLLRAGCGYLTLKSTKGKRYEGEKKSLFKNK